MADLKGNPVAHLTEYALRHLTEHLETSGRGEELHRLLALETSERRNAWHETREAVGDMAGYMADIMRGWRQAERTETTQVSLQVLYALMLSSVATLGMNVPPELIAALLKSGKWSVSTARAYVNSTHELDQRLQSRVKLLPYLSQDEFSTEVTHIAANLSKVEEETRLRVLREIVPYMSSDLVPQLIRLMASIDDEYSRVVALSLLLTRAPTAELRCRVLARALGTLSSMERTLGREKALKQLAECVPCQAVDDILPMVLAQHQTCGLALLM